MTYIDGNGDPKCLVCSGRGAVSGPLVHGRVPSVQRCSCVLVRQTLLNLDRGLKGLPKAEPLATSPIKGYEEKNLWITTDDISMRRHLRHVAARQGPDWYFKVTSDKELITAWLSTIALKGGEILDPDAAAEAASVSLRHFTIEDLAEPPTLLIIVLGIKAAANREMPQVLYEALQLRAMKDKPTWVIDQLSNPFRMGHICWSGQVQAVLDEYPHMWLDQSVKEISAANLPPPPPPMQNRYPDQKYSNYAGGYTPSGDAPDMLDAAMARRSSTKKKAPWGKK